MSVQSENEVRWVQVKALIHLKWKKLSDSDVENCRDDIGLLVSSVKGLYRSSRAAARDEVQAFRERINKESLETLLADLSKTAA